MESSRPPVYSNELKALLTSGASRTTKALLQHHLDFPTTLPPRADPASDEARLLGPFSKRRETNARWRYFVAEWQKVRPPLEVVVADPTAESQGVSCQDVRRAGTRSLPMQGLHILEDVENLAGPRWTEPRTGRSKDPHPGKPHISRWVRRRYQALLNRLPILSYTAASQGKQPKYSVSLSPNRLDPESNRAEADTSDLQWMVENTSEENAAPVAKSAARVT